MKQSATTTPTCLPHSEAFVVGDRQNSPEDLVFDLFKIPHRDEAHVGRLLYVREIFFNFFDYFWNLFFRLSKALDLLLMINGNLKKIQRKFFKNFFQPSPNARKNAAMFRYWK